MLVKTYTSGFHSFWCSGAPSAFACQQPVFNYTKVLVSLLPGIIMAVCIAVAKSTNQLALCQWHIPKAVNMKSWLQLNGLWHLVSGSDKKPAEKPEIKDSSGTILSQAVPLDKDKLERWETKAEQAAGALKTAMSQEVKVLIRDCEDDPVLIWETLKTSFIQQRTAPRFNAYHALLSVEKSDLESLNSLINRVDEHIRVIKSLSPSSFSLDNLYDELAVMAIIRALPHSFDDVVRTISILDKFDKPSVIQSLRNMDQTRNNLSSTTSAFLAAPHPSKHPQKPSTSYTVPSTTPTPSSSQNRGANRPKCDFCSRLGHLEVKCFLKEKLMRQISLSSPATAAPASTSPQTAAHAVPEAPQSASIASASAHSSVTSPDAHISSWIADTGASAHMTFNRHWMRNMTPHRIPIRLADGSVIHSEGIGSVQFTAVVHGQEMIPLEFTNVLYVPTLSSNLLSVLYLTMHRSFTTLIEKDTLHFISDNRIHFQAKVSASNSAFLLGDTTPLQQLASLSSISSPIMDLTLWHRRLCHHHFAGIKKLLSGNLVKGLKLDSRADPDLVCEACKAGKMHANPFPISHSRASRPLQLVHSDVHGPVKISTHQGFRYWITFIDDHSRFKAVYLLKRKSEAFAAFKQFKAWAENVTGERLGGLRDDKGGEYMSREFDTFCIDHGIQRQHTVRNRPQQNGVAERANRTMEEGIISMLYKSGMPPSFWGEALSSFIHIHNRVTTTALPGSTPHEAFLGIKPDVSMLRVIISERADFDEQLFLNKRHSLPPLPSPRLESLLEPSPPVVQLPYILDDALDDSNCSQQPVHGGEKPMHSEQPPVWPFHLLMKRTTLMTHWTFSMRTQRLSPSPHHSNSLSFG